MKKNTAFDLNGALPGTTAVPAGSANRAMSFQESTRPLPCDICDRAIKEREEETYPVSGSIVAACHHGALINGKGPGGTHTRDCPEAFRSGDAAGGRRKERMQAVKYYNAGGRIWQAGRIRPWTPEPEPLFG